MKSWLSSVPLLLVLLVSVPNLVASAKSSTKAPSDSTQVCTKDCIKGTICVDNQCVSDVCGGKSGKTCPSGYECSPSTTSSGSGHCVLQHCGPNNSTCPPGFWCDNGVCTQGICPIGCAVWNDGCNTCICNVPSISASAVVPTPLCTKMICPVHGTPKCIEPVGNCTMVENQLAFFQLGTVNNLVDMYDRLDPPYKALFIDRVTTASPTILTGAPTTQKPSKTGHPTKGTPTKTTTPTTGTPTSAPSTNTPTKKAGR